MADGADQFLGRDELRPRLEKALREKRPLRVKLGMDPSAPDLHLGHTVVLGKLRRFQELGHVPIFLIGDFTARIGDPSGRKKTRPALEEDAVKKNAQTYVDQVAKILDIDGAEIRFNSEWTDALSPTDWVRLCSHSTVARLLERDDFAKRYAAGESISVHEFLYPFVQAYDSVVLEADVELGGTDQTFNLLMGREVQRAYGQLPQAVITHPLLVGLDGTEKMSKSLGNTVEILAPAEEMYGKIMRISDTLMCDWFDLLAAGEWGDLASARADAGKGSGDPFALKHEIASRVVARFHDSAAADSARRHFEQVVQRRETPDDVPELEVAAEGGGVGLLDLLRGQLGVASNSEARRLVAQGAVQIDGERVDDPTIRLEPGGPYLVKAGKRRFARIRVV
ncbi:MAG: tyrosine--tRNA ligase [Deltaproteobacteria bacterium]|nr:tyrosine--tRNA ligase [Deltaproteobacteria bacterium]MBW2444729.1 tyrosine--tRNA ligase [Deltaproteobacteria bacterium]